MNPAKLHISLAAAMSSPQLDAEAMPVILKLRPGPVARGEVRALAKVRPTAEFRLLDAQAISATPELIAALSDDPAVELIWPDLPVHAWLDRAVPFVHAPRVWDTGFNGRGVKVAILDTGLDAEHPDFADRLSIYRDFVEPEAPEATEPKDPNGHGSHVAGIATGSGSASDGRYRGVAPEASLIIGRVLDAGGNGRTSQVMAGIEWAVEQGAQVINISLGGPPFPGDGTDALSSLCDAAVEHGVVVCVAAGNIGPALHTVGSPGAAARVITVAAAEPEYSSGVGAIADFSSRGPTGDGRTKPDVAFPGVGIVAPRSAGTSLGSAVGEHYTALSGTSQATPMATGTVALLLQANPRLTPDEVKARIMRGAHRLAQVDVNAQGSGIGDAYNTFISAEGTPADEPPAEPTPEVGRSGCLPAAATGFLLR